MLNVTINGILVTIWSISYYYIHYYTYQCLISKKIIKYNFYKKIKLVQELILS